MKIAFFDCQFGAAGDMLNAALLACGLDEERWLSELQKLQSPTVSFKINLSEVLRCGIKSRKMEVLDTSGQKLDRLYDASVKEKSSHECAHAGPRVAERDQRRSHHQRHEHKHHEHHETEDPDHCHLPCEQHDHRHDPLHQHDQLHAHDHNEHTHHTHEHHQHYEEHEHHRHGQHTHTNIAAIREIIGNTTIRDDAKKLAIRIFERLAAAEAQVHGTTPEEVVFHEVGAVDAIVDIVGFAVGYTLLGIEQAFVSAVPLGSGRVRTEHGLYPVPGPATLYLLTEAKAAISQSSLDFECLTPTGAAILCEIATTWGAQPSFSSMESIGYGAGTKNPAGWPNVCRVILGTAKVGSPNNRLRTEQITVIECNLDDFSPQALSYTSERLLAAGALDVFVSPVVMKKGRSGHLLSVLSPTGLTETLEEMILVETSSIGVRSYSVQRTIAERHFVEVALPGGSVRMKVASTLDGRILNAAPEFDDCANYAAEHRVPIKEVLKLAAIAFAEQANKR